MNNEDFFKLGEAVRQTRKKAGLTLKDLAEESGLSRGLISKIENARTIPSLSVLLSLARAMGCSASVLVSAMEQKQRSTYLLVRKNECKVMERENEKGYYYESLLSGPTKNGFFESVLLTLEGDTEGQAVVTDGDMMVFVLNGEMVVQLGDEKLTLEEGDSLLFDGRVPHMSQHIGKGKAQVFLTYFVRENGKVS